MLRYHDGLVVRIAGGQLLDLPERFMCAAAGLEATAAHIDSFRGWYRSSCLVVEVQRRRRWADRCRGRYRQSCLYLLARSSRVTFNAPER